MVNDMSKEQSLIKNMKLTENMADKSSVSGGPKRRHN